MYTSWCGSSLVVTSVSSDSIVSPSRYVQWGNTPLLKASWNGHAEVTRFLLESGSSVLEQNNVGWPKGASAKCPVVISCFFWYSFCLSDKILNHTECKVWPSALVSLLKANWFWTVTVHWRVNNNLSHVLYIGLCVSKCGMQRTIVEFWINTHVQLITDACTWLHTGSLSHCFYAVISPLDVHQFRSRQIQGIGLSFLLSCCWVTWALCLRLFLRIRWPLPSMLNSCWAVPPQKTPLPLFRPHPVPLECSWHLIIKLLIGCFTLASVLCPCPYQYLFCTPHSFQHIHHNW